MVADGTHTRASAFKHIVLIAVTFDGNNQIVILAFAVVDIEDSDNWVWFKEKLDLDFPGWDCWMSDKDKGIRSDAFKFSLSQSQEEEDELKEVSRCTRHLCGNCAESCKSGAMNEDHKNMIISLAKARTEEAYKLKLDALDRVNESWAAYLDARKEEFATHCFLDKGIRRFGKVTSNSVENINGALRDIRAYPIVYMIEAIVEYQRSTYLKRQKLANELYLDDDVTLTPYCSAASDETSESATKREAIIISSQHPVYKGKVQTGVYSSFTGFIEVTVDVEQFIILCPCLGYEENGTACVHGKALLLLLNEYGRGIEWFDTRYHIASYHESYSATVPAMASSGKLSLDDSYLPPDHRQMPGRPKKKRRDRSYLKKTNIMRECKACGEFGHFYTTCRKPSTEFRWKQHKAKAIEYCRMMEMNSIEEE